MIEDDLRQYLARKVHTVIVDHLDTSERMDLDEEKTASGVMSVLAGELLKFCLAMDIKEADFLRLCQKGYKEATNATRRKQN